VDCGSTDETLEIAKTLPVKVVRIPRDTLLSAAVARRVGTLNSTGAFIVFIDGDCVLEAEWLALAVAEASADPLLGGVTGRVDEVYVDNGAVAGTKTDAFGTGKQRCWMPSLGGNALYRRGALEEAGGFNPFVKSSEEGEVCYRMRKLGYKFICLPERIVTHYTEKRETLSEGWLRFRKGLYAGFGQVFRSALRNGFLLMYLRAENRLFMTLAALILGIVAALQGLVVGDPFWFAAWLGVAGLGFSYMVVKNRSLSRPTYFLVQWLMQGLSLVFYTFKPLPEADSWTPEFEVIKEPSRMGSLSISEAGSAHGS
jgi:glycosyltransferase involved in cell wall biosynthesis